MQKLGRTLARLSPARALLAGAAILAGAAGPVGGNSADGQDDVALAIPRITAPGGSPRVALPQPLSPGEAERIRRIFALQAKDDIPAAIAETAAVRDDLLLPDILADRYLANGGRAAAVADLQLWLSRYAQWPVAYQVRELLAKKAPGLAAKLPPLPPYPTLPQASSGDDVEPVEHLLARNPALDRTIHEVARSNPDRAIRLIARTRGLSREYGALLRAEVAQIVFTQGNDARALSIATDAHERSPEVGLAPFVAGLAEWRMGHTDHAGALFQTAFAAPLLQPGHRAGAAYWASRAAREAGDKQRQSAWLRRAGENSRTFYGLLARQRLGEDLDPQSGSNLTLGEADVDAVAETSLGNRAFALLQVGQNDLAAQELLFLWQQNRDRPNMVRSIMLVARHAGLTNLAAQLTMLAAPPPLHLPPKRLQPASGFRTDPALIYALARMESNFDPRAISPSGARGLLQLMPQTAEFVAGEKKTRRWHDPSVSLDIGQRYLLMLSDYDLVAGDLIRLLASYNSGPGAVAKWIGAIRHNDDPLLFIESIPNDETRAYIPRVLAYTWLYADKLNLPAPTLIELVSGLWPRFQHHGPDDESVAGLD